MVLARAVLGLVDISVTTTSALPDPVIAARLSVLTSGFTPILGTLV
jgi:hypothetical protein